MNATHPPELIDVLYGGHPNIYKAFAEYLQIKHAAESLDFWNDVSEFQRSGSRELADQIVIRYLREGAQDQINVDYEQKETVLHIVNTTKGDLSKTLMDQLQSETFGLMQSDTWRQFLLSENFLGVFTAELEASKEKSRFRASKERLRGKGGPQAKSKEPSNAVSRKPLLRHRSVSNPCLRVGPPVSVTEVTEWKIELGSDVDVGIVFKPTYEARVRRSQKILELDTLQEIRAWCEHEAVMKEAKKRRSTEGSPLRSDTRSKEKIGSGTTPSNRRRVKSEQVDSPPREPRDQKKNRRRSERGTDRDGDLTLKPLISPSGDIPKKSALIGGSDAFDSLSAVSPRSQGSSSASLVTSPVVSKRLTNSANSEQTKSKTQITVTPKSSKELSQSDSLSNSSGSKSSLNDRKRKSNS